MSLQAKITVFLFFLLSSNVNGQKMETSTSLSSGLLYSNIKGHHLYDRHNLWKLGYSIGMEYNVKFLKRIEVINSLSFKTMQPSDVYIWYHKPDPRFPTFVSVADIVYHYPVTKSVAPEVYSKDKFGAFPDFNYLYLSTCPSIIFGKNIQFQMGGGGFYGVLLNPNEAEVRVEELIWYARYVPIENIANTHRYRRFDGGLLALLRMKTSITPKVQVFASFEYWKSLTRLNDFRLGLDHAIGHIAYAGNVGVSFKMN